MYESSVPVFIRLLDALGGVLKKGQQSCTDRKIPESVMLQSRLAPDMFPLSRQVQIACDMVKGGGARLAGVAVPSYPDDEVDFAQLLARIEKTKSFLRELDKASFEGSDKRTVTLKIAGNEMQFVGQPYLLLFVLPNFYFHLTAAYAILRHNGVALEKRDFIGGLPN
ncbi:hypothetical protein TMPK1_19430 [Rhodospirillales bacterium TMPK1]|uniref:DUF1993 domain-containing protein n=2 Tax=Roseiterribacter gracilis TaxID=2812848 RepID=A0A8S8XEP0_9PROT|nr:hypothetical protein TMPK1_19430 [Rhodospirillales bacterium TMPK1]